MGSSAGIFAAIGAINGLGESMQHNTNLNDAKDMAYQQQASKLDAEKQLYHAKLQDDADFAAQQQAEKAKNDPILKEALDQQQVSQNGQIRTRPMDIADQVNANMPPQQASSATSVPQGNQPNAMPAPRTAPIGQGQPQQGGMSLPNPQSSVGQAYLQQSQQSPETVPVTSPAGQNIVAQKTKAVGDALQQGADPRDVYINSLKDTQPAKAAAMAQWKTVYGARDVNDLNALYTMYTKDPDKFETNAIKMSENWQKMDAATKNNPILLSDQGIEQRAKDFGVPVYKDSTFFNLPEKQQEAEYMSQQKQFEKEASATVPALAESVGHLQKLIGLNSQLDTGGMSALPGVQAFRSAVDDNAAEFAKESAYLVVRNKPSNGYGRVTNADLAMFKQAAPNMGNPSEANYYVAAGMLAEKQDQLDYFKFKQSWLDAYHHVDQTQIDKAWANYQDNNPIFDPNSNYQNPKMNQDRQSWQDYFAGKDMKDIPNAPVNKSLTPTQSNQNSTSSNSSSAPKTINFSDLPK